MEIRAPFPTLSPFVTFRFSLLYTFVIGILLSGFSSCKENTLLASNVLPAGDSLNTNPLDDTFTVLARTVFTDSFITSYRQNIPGTNRIVGSSFMGAGLVSSDPFFGKTFAAIAFEPSPTTANFTFGNNPRIDSVVLVLPYAGFSWGDTLSAPGIRYRVYRLSQGLTGTDSFFYSNRAPNVDRSQVFGDKTVYLSQLRDSVSVGGANRPPHLRILLDLNRFLPALYEGIAAGTTLPNFASAFRGLYVEPDAGQTGSLIPYFSFLYGTDLYQKAGIVVYYKNDGNDSNIASFPFQSAYGKVYTYLRRDYSGTPAYKFVNGTGDPNLLLLQNEPGAGIDFQMPYTGGLPKAIYNRAQLIITAIDTAFSNRYFAPPRIFPQKVNADGTLSAIADQLPEGYTEPSDFVDGNVRTATIGGITVNQYLINFPRELQRSVNSGGSALHLRIHGASGLPGAFRLIVGSRIHPLYRLTLRISYTKI